MVITSFGPSFHEQVELSLVFSINEKRPFPAVALTASAPGGGMQGRNKQGEVGAAATLPYLAGTLVAQATSTTPELALRTARHVEMMASPGPRQPLCGRLGLLVLSGTGG